MARPAVLRPVPNRRRADDTVRLLEMDPDLGAELGEDEFADVYRRLVVPGLTLPPGPCHAAFQRFLKDTTQTPAPQGALVLSGALLCETRRLGHSCARLFGPGDVFYAGAADDADLWTALAITRMAILDDRIRLAALRWPSIGAVMARRLMEGQEEQAARVAINTLPRVDQRLLALMSHVANRWGHITPAGLTVDLPLTHQMLGQLVGGRRPTVSLALAALREQRLLLHDPGAGRWILPSQTRG